jgi:type I restriction-modification system DNA methylase subunit
MDAAEYKHVVLGLIFLKYISDSFEEHHAKLKAGEGDYAGATNGRGGSAHLVLRSEPAG